MAAGHFYEPQLSPFTPVKLNDFGQARVHLSYWRQLPKLYLVFMGNLMLPEMEVTVQWISERLRMDTPDHLNHLLYLARQRLKAKPI